MRSDSMAFRNHRRVLLACAGVVLPLLGCLWLYACSSVQCQDDHTCSPPPGQNCQSEDGLLVCAAAEGGPDVTAEGDASPIDAQGADRPVDTGNLGPDGGGDAPGADAPEGFVCDPAKSPHDEPCVVDEAYGVFVSPTGSDINPGTRLLPVATIGAGMDRAAAAHKRVYVCGSNGSYTEKLVVGASRDGLSVFGGFVCSTWAYAANQPAVVAPATTGYALELDQLVMGVIVEDFTFSAHDASSTPGESSVAVFANASNGVAFHRVGLSAGQATAPGAGGADGGTAANPSNLYASSLDGNSALDAGATSKSCECAHSRSSSTGGQGGGPGALNAQMPTAGQPAYDDAGGGAAGVNVTTCRGAGTGANGADAPDAAADPTSTSLGTLSASGWSPGGGAAGSDGRPGQGGGGGGNGSLSAGGGGGGACGGCGGAGGLPGSGGGSSIALLSYQSTVTLVACTLTAKGAGNGGPGGGGEQGQAGGSPGAPFGVGAGVGCAGGPGGAGVGGNGGQGGPGGLSIGVGYSGTAPSIDGATVTQATNRTGITVGTFGTGGSGGVRGPAAPISTGAAGGAGAPGPSGVAMAVTVLP